MAQANNNLSPCALFSGIAALPRGRPPGLEDKLLGCWHGKLRHPAEVN
jgi:hypothetical protein